MSKFHRTAISRKNFSRPVQYLLKHNLLYGNILDYGCGRGGDVERLNEAGYRVMGYDPNGTYNEAFVLRQKYDMVICNFVLNVIEDRTERIEAENAVIDRLHEGGVAFLSVRNDRCVAQGKTSTGTWQGYVKPVHHNWKLIETNSGFNVWKYSN